MYIFIHTQYSMLFLIRLKNKIDIPKKDDFININK